MRCPECSAENPDNAYFCGTCGKQLRSAMAKPAGPLTNVGHGLGEEAAGKPEGEAPTPPAPAPAPPETRAAPPPAAPPPNVNAPGAGIAPSVSIPPPPPPGSSLPPPAGAPQPQGQAYQPPPGYPPPPGYGYYMPADGNTSGMGEGYPVPAEASGWTFAGFVPFGLFGFVNGSTLWGVLGLVGYVIGILSIVYWIYIGVQGRELAWRNRRFDSLAQYTETMRVWNTWGLVLLAVGAILLVLYILLIGFALFFGLLAGATGF